MAAIRYSTFQALHTARHKFCALLCSLAAVALLSGCGWQLRGTQLQEGPLPRIAIASDDNYSPMARTLRATWQKHAGNAPRNGALYTVQVIDETVDRRAVTYTASGAPAQYEMTLELVYAVTGSGAAEELQPRTMTTHRLFDFDPRNVVAKSEEERVLLEQMRQQLAQRLLSDIRRRHNLGEEGLQEDLPQQEVLHEESMRN